MLKIGNLKIPSPCILSPLDGISDLPFRMLNRSFGCEFCFAEMISARALVWRNVKTDRKLASSSDDKPLGIQLLGYDIDTIQKAIEIIHRDYQFDVIDFNAACPGNKVTKRGEGAGLLKQPYHLVEILEMMVKRSQLPVTVKIRAGWDKDSINARDIALYAQDAGIKALFIHGRTRKQQYSGTVDYKIIKEVKESLSIPVIASGDGLSPQLIKKMFDETGCDGVAIARGSLGNPWIFTETLHYLKTGKQLKKPKLDEIINTMIRHLESYCEFYGERIGVIVFRKFFNWYSKEREGVKPLRHKAFLTRTKEQMISIINELGE